MCLIRILMVDRNLTQPVGSMVPQVTRVVLSIFSLLYIATGAIYAAEHDVNPQFPDFFTVTLAEGQVQHHILSDQW